MGIERRWKRNYVYDKKRQPAGTVTSIYQGRLGALTNPRLPIADYKRLYESGPSVRVYARFAQWGEPEIELLSAVTKVAITSMLHVMGYRYRKGSWRLRRDAPKVVHYHRPDLGSPFPIAYHPIETMAYWPTTRDAAFELGSDDMHDATRQLHERFFELKGAMEAALERLRHSPSDTLAVQRLSAIVAEHAHFWGAAGGLAQAAATTLARTLYRHDPLARRDMLVAMDELRIDLGYLEAPPVLRQAIDDAAVLWGQWRMTLAISIAVANSGEMKPRFGDYWMKRQQHVHTRYDRAVQMVERLRSLVMRSAHTRATAAAPPDPRNQFDLLETPTADPNGLPESSRLLGAKAFYQPALEMPTITEKQVKDRAFMASLAAMDDDELNAGEIYRDTVVRLLRHDPQLAEALINPPTPPPARKTKRIYRGRINHGRSVVAHRAVWLGYRLGL